MDLELKEKTGKEKIDEIIESEREFFYGGGKDVENMTLSEIKKYIVSLENTKRDYLILLEKVGRVF